MAFTATQKVKLVDILGVDLETLSGHLLDVADFVTPEIETSVIADIALWDANYTKGHIEIKGNERNFGANVSYKGYLNQLRERVAQKLYVDLTKHGISSQARILRG